MLFIFTIHHSSFIKKSTARKQCFSIYLTVVVVLSITSW